MRDAGKARAVVGKDLPVTTDPLDVVRHPEIDIVVELIGGYEPARSLVLEAIARGKHVVTANKAMLARHGNEIFEAASARGVMVAFEGAVAGGVPIIKALREGLTANRIEWLAGIINGTSNFILSEMRSKGLSFAAVLAEAQRLGYAEADPTFDIEGIDAAHKLTILAAIAFGVPINVEAAYTEGIAQLSSTDIKYAEQLGYRIKLLGIAKRTSKGIELRVHPTLVPMQRLIASVEGAMNAVLVKGDAVGTTMYYGPGAGAEPTASAVVADLVDVTRMHTADPENHVPHLAFQPDAMAAVPWLTIEECVTSYYFRMRVADQPGVLADITRILADGRISIDALFQREPSEGENQTDIIMLTHDAVERDVNCGDPTHRGAADGAGAGDPDPAGRTAVVAADMRYVSTRGRAPERGFSDILLSGLADDGGLYVPHHYPPVSRAELESWRALSYADLATEIIAKFATDLAARGPGPAVPCHLQCRGVLQRTRRQPSRGHRAVALARAGAGAARDFRTDRRSPSRTWRCSCSADCSNTCSRRGAASSTSSAQPRAIPALRPSMQCVDGPASASSCCRRRGG